MLGVNKASSALLLSIYLFKIPLITIFQNDTLTDISVELCSGHGRSALLNISSDILDFSPFLLLYLRTIKELYISNCSNFSVTDFFECLCTCQSLQKLCLRGCKQFLQWHFVSYIPKLPKLQHLDLANCNSFVYGSAFAVVSHMNDLEFVDFEPANICVEIAEWKDLFITFNQIEFGPSFRCILPYEGFNYREWPYAWVNEIEE